MKKVYDVEQFISLYPEMEFKATSIYYHLHLLDDEESLNMTYRVYFNTFEELYNAVNDGVIRNAKAYMGLFKQPKIEFNMGWNNHAIITKRNFKEVCLWSHTNEVNKPITKLAELLPADEFCEYLRERGISQIGA